MKHSLIIVESPAKARTISKILGKDFVVESSIGHIRDLPSKTADIPASYRKKSWARTGVDVENGFKPLYVVPMAKKPQVKKLKALLEKAETLYLATDEDREGEAIAWHLVEVLQPKVPIKRMVFHEITKRAVMAALEHPREIDQRLVDAQEARRVLDRLYGYEVSPVLWRKVRPKLSAGRVQSVATRLVVERERQRRLFKSAAYWSVNATLLADPSKHDEALAPFSCELQEVAGRRVAIGKHFDATTGLLSDDAKREDVLLLLEPSANTLQRALERVSFTVKEISRKPFSQRPYPPFITSTLQQESARKLGFSAQRTMRVAQRLYENGYITYMRTDSTILSQEALKAARQQIESLYGRQYLPDEPRFYQKKVKGAQEAHEAIRPAGDIFRLPEDVANELDEDGNRLYQLIWKRTIASQMRDAQGERTQVTIAAPLTATVRTELSLESKGDAIFSASGKVIQFPGYLRVYVHGSDDPMADLEDQERVLPPLATGEACTPQTIEIHDHHTQPPARFTEASLVKELEIRGIGRPSTYATIIQTIQDRGYVWKKGSALVPTLTAFAVVNLLECHFSELVDYEFTSRMEGDLDGISQGEKESRPWLESFYFGKQGKRDLEEQQQRQSGNATLEQHGLHGLIGTGVEDIDARDICTLKIGETSQGEPIVARVGRFGPYLQVGDSDRRISLPGDVVVDELDTQAAMKLLGDAAVGNRVLGQDPESGKTVYLKTGAYGPYVQLGEQETPTKGTAKRGTKSKTAQQKPKMASVWPSMSVEHLTLEDALMLLSFPRVVGKHPESGADVTVQDGKFGPYVQTSIGGRKVSRSLPSHDVLATMTLDQALTLLEQPLPSRKKQRNAVIAELGTSAVTDKTIEVRTGRYGPYVTDGQLNATIPSGRDPQTISLEEAKELIAMREQKLREQGKDPRALAAGNGKRLAAKSFRRRTASTKTRDLDANVS